MCVAITNPRLFDIVTQRFHKLVAMAPEVMNLSPDQPSILHKLDHSKLRDELSPISSGRVHQLEAPSKKGLSEYDKHMSGLEQSVTKALKSLISFVDGVKEEEAKRKAKEDYMKKQEEKAKNRRAKALKKAADAGRDEAGKEAVSRGGESAQGALEDDGMGDDDQGDDQEEGETFEMWPLVCFAEQLNSGPLSSGVCTLVDNIHIMPAT